MVAEEHHFLSGIYQWDATTQSLWIYDRVGWRSFWREVTETELIVFKSELCERLKETSDEQLFILQDYLSPKGTPSHSIINP